MNNQTIIKLLTLVMVFCLPSLAFSQNLNLSKTDAHQPDPFKNYMLRTSNPCNDSQYLELRNSSGDEMTDQENAILNQKTGKCQDYLKPIEDSKPEKPLVNTGNEEPNPLRPYFIVGACATVIAVGIIIVV